MCTTSTLLGLWLLLLYLGGRGNRSLSTKVVYMKYYCGTDSDKSASYLDILLKGRCCIVAFPPSHLSPRKNGYIVAFPPGKMAI
jgi:hypothetical protein